MIASSTKSLSEKAQHSHLCEHFSERAFYLNAEDGQNRERLALSAG